MSRKIKIQTINPKNLEETLKKNLTELKSKDDLVETNNIVENTLENNNPCIENTGDAIASTNNDVSTNNDDSIVVNIQDIKNIIEKFNNSENYNKINEFEKAFKNFKDENGVTKFGSLENVKKVLKSLDTKNKPGEFVISIPQDYETTMEENNNTECNTHYEEVNHPDHYNVYDVEVVEMMERIFGIKETMSWCKLNAFKYRMRAGEKPTSTVEKDLKKEKWCLNKYKELKSKK